MTLLELLNTFLADNGVLIFLFLSLIEITPIKISPFSALFKWIGKKTNESIHKEIKEVKDELITVKQDVEIFKGEFSTKYANDMRWDILDFANSCRHGRRHNREEWKHVIAQLKEYETYVEEHGIANGVIEEETKYLRHLYQQISRNNDFFD